LPGAITSDDFSGQPTEAVMSQYGCSQNETHNERDSTNPCASEDIETKVLLLGTVLATMQEKQQWMLTAERVSHSGLSKNTLNREKERQKHQDKCGFGY